jgi:Fe-S cluster assembly scaffold protein SufB
MADCLLIHGEILFRQLTCNAVPIPDWLSPRLLAPAAAKMEKESVEAKLQPPKAAKAKEEAKAEEGKAAEKAEHEKAAADATAELAAEEAASAAAAAGAAAKAAAELPATTTDEDYLPEKVELSDSPEALPVKSIPAEDEGEDGDDDAAQG